MKEDLDFWKLYGWIKRGRQRAKVLTALSEKPVIPEQFRKELNSKLPTKEQLSLREISRHFTTFTEKGLMTSLTPNEPYGKLYVLTKKGLQIKNKSKETAH